MRRRKKRRKSRTRLGEKGVECREGDESLTIFSISIDIIRVGIGDISIKQS